MFKIFIRSFIILLFHYTPITFIITNFALKYHLIIIEDIHYFKKPLEFNEVVL